MTERLNKLDLKIFRALDEPVETQKFIDGHQTVLSDRSLEGLKFARASWKSDPGVYLMALYSGQKIIAGSRIQLFNEHNFFPFEEAMLQYDIGLMVALDKYSGLYQAEWCGLWASPLFKGWDLTHILKRAAIATAHFLEVEMLYGICPRHTMDLFKTVGFHFMTLKDEPIHFPYPSPQYTSYIIQADVSSMHFVFKEDRLAIEEWLKNSNDEFFHKGRTEDCTVKLHGFPDPEPSLLIRPSDASSISREQSFQTYIKALKRTA